MPGGKGWNGSHANRKLRDRLCALISSISWTITKQGFYGRSFSRPDRVSLDAIFSNAPIPSTCRPQCAECGGDVGWKSDLRLRRHGATRRTRAECADRDYRGAIIDVATIGSRDLEDRSPDTFPPALIARKIIRSRDRGRSRGSERINWPVASVSASRADSMYAIALAFERSIESLRLSLLSTVSAWFLELIVTSLKHA